MDALYILNEHFYLRIIDSVYPHFCELEPDMSNLLYTNADMF